jgi:glycosyltransferase involved in cell wall biosynthesis
MRISFLTSGHLPYDDRIFWHMGKALSETGHIVEIISSKLFLKESSGVISINCFEGDHLPKKDKTDHFIELLGRFHPDIIICSEPLPVIAGNRYRKKSGFNATVIYDITEWYPSRKNLLHSRLFLRWIIFIKLLAFNLFASHTADAFVFGEWFKSRPYRLLFPFKPFSFVTYFPDLNYLRKTDPGPLNGKLRLVYSGKISMEKGFGNFINVIRNLSELHPDLFINLKIIGWYESDDDRNECDPFLNFQNKNISVEVTGRLNFIDFISEIKQADIFLDLRKRNFESQRSLPIKLFYYAALGRPVIFTDLKAIRRDVRIEEFGYLVKPDDTETISKIISGYLKNQDLYIEHCINARKMAEEKYNWQQISQAFIKFIESFSPV